MYVRALPALAILATTAIAQDSSPPSLTSLLSNTSDLSNLTSYVQQFPDLLNQLGSATNITILAPNNNAFAEFLNSSVAQTLAGDPSLVQHLLTYHVLNGTYSSQNISKTPAFIPTLLTDPIYSNVTGGQVVEAVLRDNNAVFYSGLLRNSSANNRDLVDVAFEGGLVHVIDRVLTIPLNISTTAVALNLTSAAGALTTAELVPALDTIPDATVFIPNNEAFQRIGSALPNLTAEQVTSILQYHVVNGTVGYSSSLSNTSLTTLQGNNITITVSDEAVFVNSAKVLIPNVLVANGVVHVIDNVLNPDNSTATNDTSAVSGSPAFAGASSAPDVPFTSGVPVPTSTIPTAEATSAGGGGGGAAATSTPSEAGAQPMRTAAVGAAALFGAGAGAAFLNL